MTIREGALTSTNPQDKTIRDYMDRIHLIVDRVLSDRERIPKYFLMKLLSKFEPQNLSLKRGVKLTTKYIFDDTDTNGGEFVEKITDKTFIIIINMAHCVIGSDEIDEQGVSISEVDWSEFYSIFVHEYKHFLQVLSADKHVDPFASNEKTDYFDKPHEQQAWAEGYLEKLKYQLQTADSAVILNFLRTNALSNSPSLYYLKQTNPSAWRKIMKQAVLAAIRDADQKQ
jgi:hypothetical protein